MNVLATRARHFDKPVVSARRIGRFAIELAMHLVFDLLNQARLGVFGDRALAACGFDTRQHLVRVERLTPTVFLGDGQARGLLYPLVRREPLRAAHAFAAPTDHQPAIRGAAVNHLVVVGTAIWADHEISNLPARAPASCRKPNIWAVGR